MLRITHAEELTNLALLVPSLVEMQEAESFQFPAAVSDWMKAVEESLASARSPQTAVLASLRAGINAARRGQVPDHVHIRGRPTRSRTIAAVATQALHEAAAITSNLLLESNGRFTEASALAQQIAALASARDAIPTREAGVTNTMYLSDLRAGLGSIDEFAAALIRLDGLVGPYDALVVLDRALEPYMTARA